MSHESADDKDDDVHPRKQIPDPTIKHNKTWNSLEREREREKKYADFFRMPTNLPWYLNQSSLLS